MKRAAPLLDQAYSLSERSMGPESLAMTTTVGIGMVTTHHQVMRPSW